jgi:hypothetical protein
MSENTIATEVTETKQPVKRGRKSRKDKSVEATTTKVQRGTRVPLGGFTGPLALREENMDPSMKYVWPLDDSEDGSKIERRLQAGYEFCSPKENLVAGSTSVYATRQSGSIIRIPAGQGKYHYLMKIPLEWYEDDQKAKAARVTATEQSLHNQAKKDGFFGGLQIG